MEPQNLTAIFGKFAGQEVKDPQCETGGISDPVIEAMRAEATKHGFRLRVWFPGTRGTTDYRTDRVNAHIEQADDGKWRIGNRFNIG
jgi:hypothetical protein